MSTVTKIKFTGAPEGAVPAWLPMSKSIAAREMIISYIAGYPGGIMVPDGACEDIRVLSDALIGMMLGVDIIHVGESGTALRFLTALMASEEGRTFRLRGSMRLMARPLEPLISALKAMGAIIGWESANTLRIRGTKLVGGEVKVNCSESSQFVSALMLIAPRYKNSIRIRLLNATVSHPYIDMTIGVMMRNGAQMDIGDRVIDVRNRLYRAPLRLCPEADWSAAASLVQAVLTINKEDFGITTEGLLPPRISLQGDAAVCRTPGFRVAFEGDKYLFTTYAAHLMPPSLELDCSATPDLVPALAMAYAARKVPFTISGVSHLRYKESDRLEAISDIAWRLGRPMDVDEDDHLIYNGDTIETPDVININPHNDHRIAMAAAIMAAAIPGRTIVMRNAECVSKSFPTFWQMIVPMGYDVTQTVELEPV